MGERRYLLFAGRYYYPEGGWADFRGAFATIDEAQAALQDWHQWAHVVDREAGAIVAEWDNDPDGEHPCVWRTSLPA